MSFKYQGNDITNNFDDSIPGSQTTGFKINGVDIGTTYTPAYTGFTSTSTTNYKNNGTDIKSLFSSSKPVPTITISEGTDSNDHDTVSNFGKLVKHESSGGSTAIDHHFTFYQDGTGMSEDGQMYSEYNIHVSDVADCEVEIVLCAGGGCWRSSSGYPGPGGGGAGEVKQGTITLQKNSNYTLRVGLGGHNKAFFVYTGKGNNTTLSGPGIDNIGIQAHGGGHGATPGYSAGDGGCGGGGSHGGHVGSGVPGFPEEDENWYNALTSYSNNGGFGYSSRGGGGGGGAGGAGSNAHPSNGMPGNGGDTIQLYGETMAGGGGGRGDEGRDNHGTSYNTLYGSGGRATELPGKGGLAMLRFNEDQAITGHSYSVNLFLN